jgi:hypothetical protein
MASLTLSLGLFATAVYGDEGAWGPSPPSADSTRLAAPAAQLGRPIAVGAPADPLVEPASFAPVYRGQAADARRLPAGPGELIGSPHDWQQPVPGAPAQATVSDAYPPQGDCGDCGCGCGHPLLGWLFHKDGCCDGGCNGGSDGGCGVCDACREDGGCCDNNHLYVSGEYLSWWTKGDPLPPLVTAGSVGDLTVPGVSAGAIDRPGSVVLFGNSQADAAMQSGARIMVGWWFGDDHCIGIEGGGFFLGRQNTDFAATSFGTPILARPFFNVLTGAQDVEFVAEPGNAAVPGVAARPPLAGSVSASAQSNFWGAEANLRTNLCCGSCYNVDLIGGYRYLGLDDSLTISENLQAFNVATPFVFSGNDTFQTRNRFNGGQLGLKGEWRWNRWSLDSRTIIAIGDVSQEVDVLGFKTVNGVTTAGDLLTQAGTNIGVHRQNRFAWSPEVALNLGYQLTDHMRVFVGYDFLYISSVVRAGNQVNLNVNPNPLRGMTGGPAQPAFAVRPSDFWAQGVNFGLEFRY